MKMDSSRMDYLKAIFACFEKDGFATNKTLTDRLNVSPSSVTEMVKKLLTSGDVILDKKNIYLSEKGLEEVKKILTKHRLWEYFLVERLGYSWQEVHEEADVLEHATSDLLKDRLNAYLNHPKHCPHGSEIFQNHTDEDYLRRLDTLNKGDSGYIHRVSDDRGLLSYLEGKGIALNQEIFVKHIDPYDGSYVIEVEGKEVVLALLAAQKIRVMMKGERAE